MLEDFLHTADKLEFAAVLDIIAGLARSERSMSAIRATRPAESTERSERSQAEVMELMRLEESGESLPLSLWRDSYALVDAAKAEGHLYTGEELAAIASAEERASETSRFLARHAEELPLISAYRDAFSIQTDLVAHISRAIGRDYEVVDRASERLSKLRKELGVLRGRLRRRFSEFAERIGGGKGYEFVTIRGERYVVSIPRGEAGRLKGIVHQTSASGASFFVEPLEFVDENNRLESLIQDERDEVTRILLALSTEVLQRKEALLANQEALLALDLASAKSEFARRFGCIKPEHGQGGSLILRAARHPLLERRFAEEGGLRKVKPLDIDCDGDLRVLVISGPNAGGKTVVLKTVGLLVLMDRAGLPVPCAHGSRIPDYEMVYVDIGDDQSIERSLSTFSSRIVRLKRILESANDRSLVLIDEIGDGTDPEEGAALAKAALERLMSLRARVIVTTHLKPLKGWAHGTAGARNATLEFDPDRLEPLFILRMGVPGRSWGLEMAGRLGLPREIVEGAMASLGSDSLRLEELLSHLEKAEHLAVEEGNELRKKEELLTGLVESYREKLDRFKKDRDDLVMRAREEALEIVSSTRRDMERLIREIKTTQAERNVIRDAHASVNEKQRVFEKQLAASKPPPRRANPGELRTGMWAEIASLGKEGKIVSIDASRAFLELDGGLRVETHIGDLCASRTERSARRERKAFWTMEEHTAVTDEISVRGLEKAEAMERVDQFLDRAVLQGFKTVTVIHGIGKGILKRAIYDLAKKDPRIAGVRPGDPARGGDGVAIIDLK
ncbi:MAG: Smr/MutS family protein [Candidatus Krumholzibacteria bacterium]|nr:Smr/MutS family protein [Candidatus Krumholzibacteria bacterium]